MFDPRPLCCSSLTTAVGGTKDTNIVDSESPYRGTNQVIVDRLTKSTHFLAVRMTFTLEEFGKLYKREIVWLHGVPVSIVLDQDPRFMTHFWKSFQRSIGTQLMMTTTFHPHTDSQSDMIIQILEDMLWGTRPGS